MPAAPDGDEESFSFDVYVSLCYTACHSMSHLWADGRVDDGRIAQLVERFPYKEEVTGSSPVSPTWGGKASARETPAWWEKSRGLP